VTDFKPDGEGQGKLIVVSNREPYLHKRSGSDVSVEIPAGGLTSAMNDVLRKTGGTWVAWGSGEADRESVDSNDCVAVPPDMSAYTLKRVWLSDDEVENYYHGYANQVLWPLCHITLDRVNYRQNFWLDYTKANEAFARAVLEEAGEGSTVWVHDYHLCLVPRILRERMPGLTIAHFWHIPWPDWGVFKVCPQARDIIEGLLGNDLIGFQIPLFAKNFMDCVKGCLDAEIDYQSATISYAGHTTRLKAFPISIDAGKFSSLASSSRTAWMMEAIRLRHRLDKVKVGIGVDRLEYTKALIKRLQAINLFFERYPEFREKFTFIQIAVATRMREPYISYKKAVEELVSAVNERYSTDGWLPVVYLDEKVEQRDLVAYYRMADMAIISSVYDGMNLVAKEYAASQVDGSGVLILSELAGAAEGLEGALLVNPYDSEGFSDLIHKALMMPDKEKKERMSSLREQVRDNDISLWMSRILHELAEIESMKRPADDRLCESDGKSPGYNRWEGYVPLS
jgi:alpha,alpha-trehalose-phosphate synthase [UDP-forming]